jgi:hypothetical protein
MQVELRDLERAVASGTREAGQSIKTELRLFRGKGCVRRCRLVFRDCGAGTGGGLAA